jgi:hypothetical protein
MTEERLVRFEDHGVVFVKVENLDEGQRQRRGQYQWLDEARALRGAAAGLWRIIEGEVR